VGAFLNEIAYFVYLNQRIEESNKLDVIHENLDSSVLILLEEIQLEWKEKDSKIWKKKLK
jgi:predicted chitinase